MKIRQNPEMALTVSQPGSQWVPVLHLKDEDQKITG